MKKIRKHGLAISNKHKEIFKFYQDGEVPVLDPAENSKMTQKAKYLKEYQKEK